MPGIFSITEDHINRLSDEDCVELFGELLHANARQLKIPVSKITFTWKTRADGGIDASVEGGLVEEGDLIIDSETFYQIKSGVTFSPWQPAVIKDELLGDKDEIKENLGSEIQRCFEHDGTYVLVCMKKSLTTAEKNDAEENLKTVFVNCGISNPKVKVWGQEKIIGTLYRFPSLMLRVTGRDRAIFLSHKDWATGDEMGKTLVIGKEQEEFIKTIRESLTDDSEAIHLNVYGETGVGKTRLIFESTKDPFLEPLVVYVDNPRNFKDSRLMTEIIRDETLHVILIIDECQLDDRLYIWEKLKNLNSRIKLVTIYNEYIRTHGTTKQKEVPNLDNEHISEIIQLYYHDRIIADQLASICGGIPRLAHAVGWDAEHNPEELLRGISDTSNFFGRYLNYGEDPDSSWVKQRKRILLTTALFKKFGFGNNFKDEMNAIHKLIYKLDNSITLGIFQEHVKQLRKRKILQAEDTLYISPKGFHLWLWMKWWESYGSGVDFEELVKELPSQLRKWFFDMFEYAANSDVTKSIVIGLFSTGGPLHDSNAIKTCLGAKFFQSLTAVDPKSATEYLEKTMGTWSYEELKKFKTGRREVIYGLERIIFEPELFTRGGVLLRNLAEAENEEWSNNATGLFTGLFSLGTGYVSLTKAAPTMRISLLKETLCSENEIRRNLGLKACETALQAMHFSRVSGLSGDELRIDQKGWEPKNYKEWREAYEEVIDLMIEKIKTFPKEDQRKGASIIFSNARGILHALPNIGEYIVDRLFEIKDFVGKETSLRNIIDILEFDKEKLEPKIKSRLEDLQNELTGTDYSSLMKRYVGMDIMMDLAKKNREEERMTKIQELAKESLDVSKLKSELDWLVTFDAKYGYVFGQELTKLDESYSLLPLILDAQRNTDDTGSGFFLSGYLLKIFEADKEKWNKIMIEISRDEKLVRFFSELAWRSGITNEIGQLLLDLIKTNKIQTNELGQFVLGGVVNKLSTEIVTKWIEYMLQTNDQKVIYNAINLYNSFFVHREKKSLDPELTLRLLTNSVFMGNETIQIYDTMVDYYWKEIGLLFIKQHPQKSLELADKILESMGSASSIVSSNSQTLEVLDKISSDFPNETWELVTKYIDLPFDERGFAIIQWMRGGIFAPSHSFLDSVDFPKISDWIDHDPHKRAAYITEHTKPELKKENSLARELLVKYGDDETVQKSLARNFGTGGFSGPGSVYYQKRKDEILAYKETEDNENVKNWIDFYVKCLDDDIKREKLSEERDF